MLKWRHKQKEQPMGLFGLGKKKSTLSLAVKAPTSVTTADMELRLTVTLRNVEATTVNSLVVRLRGDIAEKKHAANAAPYQFLGEITYPQEIKMAPGRAETVNIYLPLDFSPLDSSYEIPPENLAAASEEMRAAAAAARSVTYNYSIEVQAKVSGNDQPVTIYQPIQVIDPNQIHTGSF